IHEQALPCRSDSEWHKERPSRIDIYERALSCVVQSGVRGAKNPGPSPVFGARNGPANDDRVPPSHDGGLVSCNRTPQLSRKISIDTNRSSAVLSCRSFCAVYGRWHTRDGKLKFLRCSSAASC